MRVGGALVESRRQGGCGQAALPGEPGPAQFGALGARFMARAWRVPHTARTSCPALSVYRHLCRSLRLRATQTDENVCARFGHEQTPG